MKDEPKVREMSQEDLRKMQMVELDLLLELDRICRKYNIRYMLCGGTLIGAVRHKGFIPWDDDVDVRMLRSEYNKFVEACKKELDSERYFLQDFESDPGYRWGYAKLTNINTVYKRTGQYKLKMRKYMFIDIFISDGVPNSKIGYEIQRGVCFCIRKVLWSPVGMVVSKNPILRMWYGILSMIPRNASVALINAMSKMFPEEKANSFRSLTFPQKGGVKKEWMENLIETEFEGHMLYISAYADDWLKMQYGDYMKLPPEEERMGHNTAAFYRFEDEVEK